MIIVDCTIIIGARKVLTSAGYSDIEFTGYKWFACGEGDVFHTGFKAKGPTGIQSEGCVCEGLIFKNSTIRFK